MQVPLPGEFLVTQFGDVVSRETLHLRTDSVDYRKFPIRKATHIGLGGRGQDETFLIAEQPPATLSKIPDQFGNDEGYAQDDMTSSHPNRHYQQPAPHSYRNTQQSADQEVFGLGAVMVAEADD